MFCRRIRELNEEGRLPIRVNEQIRFRRTDQLQRFLDLGYRANDAMGGFEFGPVKFLCDGSLGSHSAAMRQPYHNKNPDTKGLLLFTDEELYELAKLAYTNGYHLTAHCIGDAALEQSRSTPSSGSPRSSPTPTAATVSSTARSWTRRCRIGSGS